MRLIDAEQFDCIAWGEKEEKEYGDTFKGGVEFILDKIHNAPTVVHEKQVPKKPIFKYTGDEIPQKYWVCPICGEQPRIAGHMMAVYCCKCGQAIDWDESR